MSLPQIFKNILEKIGLYKPIRVFSPSSNTLLSSNTQLLLTSPELVKNVNKNKSDRIKMPAYLDSTSTTPLDPRCLDAMLPYLTHKYGNPASRTHPHGWISEIAVNKSREQISDLVNCTPSEIIYTSGATESNNLALAGVCEFFMNNKSDDNNSKNKFHIITSQYEHKSVLDTCRHLEERGVEVTYLPITKDGTINPEEVKKHIKPNTKLVSIMALNNEIGTINPLKEIGLICKENKIYFHTDAAQAFGKIPLDVNDMNIDLMSISSHKIYGPKGIGALYIRKRPRVRLLPILFGGGQERGLRSGTLPTALIVGLGKAAEISKTDMNLNARLINEKANNFTDFIKSEIEIIRNGLKEKNWPGCLNLSFPYVEGEGLLMKLNKFALSSGSACTSASLEPSYVLRALGNDDVLAHSSIRFSFGRFTTDEEVKKLGEATVKGVNELKAMSPLAEMVEEGIDLKTIDWA
ncbi:putative cysteine desulfurase, mitochondrial [Cucumispora dikerogammari]|nr:putative cysteine desulfurase, mitochondrial [Cucumispora dikerogammari]